MASGIDWFRWHHGSITDPKFQLVAKKAAARFGDVIALWAFILETASSDADRGNIGPLDFETIDHMLGAEEGTSIRILDAMTARGLIVENRIASWDKRQPKREREDSNAAERKIKQRELASVGVSFDVTPCHAMSRQEKPREEESREDSKPTNANALVVAGRPAPNCPHQKIIESFGNHLPTMPYPKVWEGQRQQNLAARWRWVLTAKKQGGEPYATDSDSALRFFDRFFAYVAKSDFLTGRDGKWQGCDLGWLVKAENFAKVISGNYENKEAA